MNRIKHFAWLLLFAGSLLARADEHHAPPAPKIELGTEEARLPMSFRSGLVTVEASVNGKGPYHFFFDTGAAGAIIDQGLAKELKLPVVGEAGVKSGGDAPDKKPIPAQLVNVDRLQIGSIKLSSVTIIALAHELRGGSDGPVGVLSPAMFPGYLVTYDYSKKEIRIRAGELGDPDQKTIFPYLKNHHIPSLMVTVGDETLEAHLDTGSGQGLFLPTKLADKLTLDGKLVDSGRKAESVSGKFTVFEGKLKGKLSFGQFSFADPTIQFSDVVRVANLGARILDRFVLTIDAKSRRFQMVEQK